MNVALCSGNGFEMENIGRGAVGEQLKNGPQVKVSIVYD